MSDALLAGSPEWSIMSCALCSGIALLRAEHVLQLACMVFKAEAAAVTLMGKV